MYVVDLLFWTPVSVAGTAPHFFAYPNALASIARGGHLVYPCRRVFSVKKTAFTTALFFIGRTAVVSSLLTIIL